jgi:hypothetical protein
MAVKVAKEMAAMRQMTIAELRERYADVFGEPTTSRHGDYLRKRILWRLQANAEGGLSGRALQRAEELANDADLRLHAPKPAPPSPDRTKPGRLHTRHDKRLPMPGTVITREYKGETITVTVLEGGFEYDGNVYRSLSAVAMRTRPGTCAW